DVVDDFIAEYSAGRTPNPCMRCNERIKFAALMEKALALGFDAVATGHYANIVTDAAGNRELHRAADWAKDQSYVLGVLTADQLAHSMFPLGATPSKAEVRAEAAARGFALASKPDSHDICFIPDGDTRGWLADKVGAEQGTILDRSGAKLGVHEGAAAFTIGQRKGINVGYPTPDGRPRFVLEVRPSSNEVVVGPREALALRELAGSKFSWAGLAPDAANTDSDGFGSDFDCHVQVRAHSDPVPAVARVSTGSTVSTSSTTGDSELVINLVDPIIGVAPGQTAVLYIGTRVLGQFTIDRTVSAVSETVGGAA
ncbi:MAG: tRNA 2-thiouridine(34) synthase MnmA, partial [Rhodoglobus sp.]|nr:tRNA 2-thiouridine(34) synthase MnmA [Rhodoglobus sp.]